MTVGVGLIVGVGVVTSVGVDVGSAEGVDEGGAVVEVAVGVDVAVSSGVGLCVEVAVGSGAAIGEDVAVGVGMTIGSTVGVYVGRGLGGGASTRATGVAVFVGTEVAAESASEHAIPPTIRKAAQINKRDFMLHSTERGLDVFQRRVDLAVFFILLSKQVITKLHRFVERRSRCQSTPSRTHVAPSLRYSSLRECYVPSFTPFSSFLPRFPSNPIKRNSMHISNRR